MRTPDNDPRGPWTSGDLSARNPYSKGTYGIKCPGGRVINGPPPGNYWRHSEEKFWQLDADNRIWWGSDRNQVPRFKRFLFKVKQGLVPETIWTYKEVGHTQEAKKELLAVFGEDFQTFTTLKPTKLLDRILRIGTKEDSLVLDAFAGSGTTAHSVLKQNAEDGANRRFILIECQEYANTITAERIRRVIKGVPAAKSESLKKGLDGSFSFFEIGNPLQLEDILDGENLPKYTELARYIFYTATGEEFNEEVIDQQGNFIGESRQYQVYLFYEPEVAKLKNLALTLEMAINLPPLKEGKRRLVFAPTKYLDQEHLDLYKIDFAQLPFEIYELAR